MPIYNFACACGKEWEAYVSLRTNPNPACECGGTSERVWSIGVTHRPGGTYPYVTTNLDPSGKPIEVRSAAHLDSLCKAYGVVHRPDNGWLTKEYKGVDFRTGEQKYTEGSGLGMKGCWF